MPGPAAATASLPIALGSVAGRVSSRQISEGLGHLPPLHKGQAGLAPNSSSQSNHEDTTRQTQNVGHLTRQLSRILKCWCEKVENEAGDCSRLKKKKDQRDKAIKCNSKCLAWVLNLESLTSYPGCRRHQSHSRKQRGAKEPLDEGERGE